MVNVSEWEWVACAVHETRMKTPLNVPVACRVQLRWCVSIAESKEVKCVVKSSVKHTAQIHLSKKRIN